MASNVVNILIQGRDQFSKAAAATGRSAKKLSSGPMAALQSRVGKVAMGFIAAQASIAGVQAIMTKTIGSAMKFEHQIAQIRALTGATKKDTDFLTGAIKDMSKELGKAPAELAAGAYFILSSGIEDAAEAAEVLEVAAKASVVGLGETEQVADALTTVLNAYSMEASEAGHVTDVLMQAVKDGKAEADAFAGVLGRVVPLASQMGISFEEVAANMATFTRLGVSAEMAATGLRQVMASLLKPTKDTEEALAEIGLSAKQLRTEIKEKGLMSVLGMLMERFKGNEEAIARVFPNIRALTSVLGTAGVGMEAYAGIVDNANNATGNLEDGLAIMTETTQHKVQVAMAELNLALMELGGEVLPVVVAAAQQLSGTVRILSGDFDLFSQSVRESNDNITELNSSWLGTTYLGLQLEKGVKGLGQELGILGKSYPTEETEGVSDATDRAITAFRHEQRVLRQVARESQVAAGETGGLTTALDALRKQLDALTGTYTTQENALDRKINALELDRNAALQAEVGQSSLGRATGSTTDAIDDQIDMLEKRAASAVPQALKDEVAGYERELRVLQMNRTEIEAQITARNRLAQVQLAMANVANLPAMARQKKLELERAKILQKVGGNTEKLTDAQKKQIEAIDRAIQRLQANINVRTLEAELTNIQAEASDTNRRALEAELTSITDQISATERLKRERELYIDTLEPTELLNEIEALKDHREEMAKSERRAGSFGGAIQLASDDIADQIDKLDLERTRLDLVAEGYDLVGKAMGGLPSVAEVTGQYKALLLLQFAEAMLQAVRNRDPREAARLAGLMGQVAILPSAQGGAFIPPGVTTPMMLHGGSKGEAVIPLDKAGAGGNSYHFHFDGPILGDEAVAMQFAELLMPHIREQAR